MVLFGQFLPLLSLFSGFHCFHFPMTKSWHLSFNITLTISTLFFNIFEIMFLKINKVLRGIGDYGGTYVGGFIKF